MKKVLVIVSSLRKGNSETLADEFIKGAIEGGNDVTKIALRDLNIKYCHGCGVCQQEGKCILNDDMDNCLKEMESAHVIVFATPIYFGEICGQLKVFMDRCYPLYPSLNNKKGVIIASCYKNDKKHIDESINSIRRFLTDIGNIEVSDVIYGENCDDIYDVSDKQKLYAYESGKRI